MTDHATRNLPINMVKLGNLIERPSGATNTLGPATEGLVPMRSKRNMSSHICLHCGAAFTRPIDRRKKNLYCSPACSGRAQAVKRRTSTPTPDIQLDDPNARIIPLTQGKITIVDNEDFELLSSHHWFAHKNRNTWYAKRYIEIEGRGRRLVPMHRIIIDVPEGLEVDHINGDGLDNRKANLRIATRSENTANSRRTIGKNRTGYRGVQKSKRGGWEAKIDVRGRRFYLGSYPSPIDAAHAYDVAAFEHFGDFAILNFPEDMEEELARAGQGEGER